MGRNSIFGCSYYIVDQEPQFVDIGNLFKVYLRVYLGRMAPSHC
jgi:hypothetical protein